MGPEGAELVETWELEGVLKRASHPQGQVLKIKNKELLVTYLEGKVGQASSEKNWMLF